MNCFNFQDLGDRLELADIYMQKARGSEKSYEYQIHDIIDCHSQSSISVSLSPSNSVLLFLLLIFNNIINKLIPH